MYRAHITEETASLNRDLLAKNVYFSTQECGCYIFLTQTVCILTLKGLCVTELSSGAFG